MSPALNSYLNPINIWIHPAKVQTFRSIPEEPLLKMEDRLGSLQLEEEYIED